MAETAESLFERYCAERDRSRRIRFALAAPRLMWSKTVKGLLDRQVADAVPRTGWSKTVNLLLERLGSRPPTSREREREREREMLSELEQLRHFLLMRPEGYPIGDGPIEQLLAGGLPRRQALEACRDQDLQALLAPFYLRCLAYHAANLTRTDDFESGIWLSRLAVEAALAWEPVAPIDRDITDVVLAHLEAAMFSTLQSLDDSVFSQAVAAGVQLLDRAEQQHDRATIGKLCQSIGALFGDIWTVPGRPQDSQPVAVEEWLVRPRRSEGLFEGLVDGVDSAATPGSPDACLRTAVHWFRRALPYREGAARGLSYKAIVQTEEFRRMVLKQATDDDEMRRSLGLGKELLSKHPDGATHLAVLDGIAARRGWVVPPPAALAPEDALLMSAVAAAYEPGPAHESAERRRSGHQEAVQDLGRVLRHRLPWALYLRNFDHANEIRMLGDVITHQEDGRVHVVVPQISYSLVDHKILQLFPEGVLAVCDPALTEAHRLTQIPMLSLHNDAWLPVVRSLIERSHRIVMLLDELTPGVQAELDLLVELGAAPRTLIVTGHAFRTGAARLPPAVPAAFPHLVDWIDFAFDESHHDQRYKAHGIIQHHLPRYVRANARPVVQAWLHPPGAAAGPQLA